MDTELFFKIATLLRLVAFMLLVYLGLGLVVERYSTKPDSQLKAFFRVVCWPITRPVGRYLAPNAEHRRVLLVSMAVVAAFWAATVIATKALKPG